MNRYMNKEKWKNLFYTLTHPMDGFYWIRRKDKGSVPIAVIMVLFFGISFSLNRYLSSFIVNDINERDVNIITELIGVAVLFLLFCTANWSVTCLMNGEGRFKDILVVIGYSLLPLNLLILPATAYSQFVTKDEKAFYSMIIAVGIVWTFVMAIIGIMQVHNYSLAKTLLTLILTMLALFIIIFLLLLLIDLVNQVYCFIRSIYLEILVRNA